MQVRLNQEGLIDLYAWMHRLYCCSRIQSLVWRRKNGSSRIVGKDALDLHEKEFAVPVTVSHSLDDRYSIVYSFQLTGVHWPANPAHDAAPVTF